MRQAVNLNGVLTVGETLEDFSDTSVWTPSGQYMHIEDDPRGGIKIYCDSAGANMTQTVNYTTAVDDVFILELDIPDVDATSVLTMYLSNDGTFTDFFNKSVGIGVLPGLITKNGLNRLYLRAKDFTVHGAAVWTVPQIRLRFTLATDGPEITLKGLYRGYKSRPKVIFTFDDTQDDQYTEAFAYANPRGIKTTHYINKDYVGVANCMTLAQLQEMYAAGCDMGNHTTGHLNLRTTQDLAVSAIETTAQYLCDNGMPRASRHLAYPYSYGEVAGDDYIQGYAALANVKSARGTQLYHTGFSRGLCNQLSIGGGFRLGNADTLADAKTAIDDAITYGTAIVFYGHKLVAAAPADATEWLISDWQALIDYTVDKVAAGLIDAVTISEFISGLAGRRPMQ